jgi:cbb3-type cytochrome oxidase subunit 3
MDKENKKKFHKSFLILFLVILISVFIFNIYSCKNRNKSNEENLLINENDQSEKLFITEKTDEYVNINWEEEKQKLEKIGTINDVPSYCKIIAIISIELRKLEDSIISRNISDDEKNRILNKKKDELLNYFNITQEALDKFYEENKVSIENFILSHDNFRKAIETE